MIYRRYVIPILAWLTIVTLVRPIRNVHNFLFWKLYMSNNRIILIYYQPEMPSISWFCNIQSPIIHLFVIEILLFVKYTLKIVSLSIQWIFLSVLLSQILQTTVIMILVYHAPRFFETDNKYSMIQSSCTYLYCLVSNKNLWLLQCIYYDDNNTKTLCIYFSTCLWRIQIYCMYSSWTQLN